MPINYLNLQPQINEFGNSASDRLQQVSSRKELCLAALRQFANKQADLQKLIAEQHPQDRNLRCAKPFSEALDVHVSCADETPPCVILAADGSQITPDPHAAVLYGLINVGVFRMSLGKGEAPQTNTWSDLIYEDSDPENTEYISEDLISLMRDVFEREIMAKLARQESSPLLTFTDGPLELYHEPRNEAVYRKHFDKYIHALQELALLETLTAGYIDRPRAALLVTLLELASGVAPNEHPFAGVSDLDLMKDLLAPGERSAVFTLQSSSSDKYPEKLALHFFYLNVGSAAHPAIARVEIPLWVAGSNDKVSLIQRVLLDQAAQSGAHPYPYALTRAHETAVVKMDEHEYLDDLLIKELLAHGVPLAEISEKLMNKLVGKRTRY
jgi:hypothetical protein